MDSWQYIFMMLLGVILVIPLKGSLVKRRAVRQTQSGTGTGRIDCYPESEAVYSNYSKASCLARNCLFDESANSNGVPCYFQSNYGYILQGNEVKIPNGKRLYLRRNQAVESPFPEPIENVTLDVQYYTNDIIRVKLYDTNNRRYEVPIPLTVSPGGVSSPQYNFNYSSDSTHNNILSFSISRNDNQTVLFDTSIGGLVLNNQFLQIVSRLQSPHVYGFGENNHETLKHNVSSRLIWGVFPRDQSVYWGNNTNQYGTHPFYLVMEQVPNSNGTPSGQMSGVLILTSNAMDYSFNPDPSVTVRTIGGILDIFVFLGPSPEQVIQQYTWLVGRPMMPPYWSLGFHLSRWGYGNLTHMKLVNQRNRDAGVPLDVQFADIDYMDNDKDFTIDPVNFAGLKEYFTQLNSIGVRTIIILDPGTFDNQISYTPTVLGINQSVYITWENGTAVKTTCWPGELFLPDFFKNRARNWWQQLITNFRAVNLTFDGLWIDMNEPALFGTNDDAPWNWATTGSNYTLKCPQSKWDDPPYRTKAVSRHDNSTIRPSRISDRTMCMVAVQGETDPITGQSMYRHYDVHSLYGWSETKPTLDVVRTITGKRGLVLPRSTFVGSGQWAAHWLGDNAARWYLLKESLIGIVEFNWFGIPMVGADICGFDEIATEELCIRWQQAGAFYPYSRNHHIWQLPDQDPAAWSPAATAIMVTALRIRYTILPYYYTLFYKAHTQGSTVIRPLFHEFPTDQSTLDVYLQFLIGSCIMIAPVTDSGALQVQVYIPSASWYDYYTGSLIPVQNGSTVLPAPLSTIPILLRGGAIIPTQVPANNTKYSRTNPFGLIIVLDSDGNAQGDLFYDDGETIDTIETNSYFYATYQWSSQNNQLTVVVIQNNYAQMSILILDSLSIYGLNGPISNISVNGKSVSGIMRPATQIVDITGLGLSMSNSYIATWSCQNLTGMYCNGTSSQNGNNRITLSKYLFFYIVFLFPFIVFV